MNNEGQYSRTAVYLEPQNHPKHMFVSIGNLIAERFSARFALLDVGCANGAFLAYASSRFPGIEACGVDADPVLIETAKTKVIPAAFSVADANTLNGVPDSTFETVTLTGTHSIFDDFRPSFDSCIRVAKPGGRIIITGIFNPFPVDAKIHWRYGTRFQDAWHPGYNLFSHLSVQEHLEALPRVSKFTFLPFSLPFDIPRREDPIRSWTEMDEKGGRLLRNGIMPLNFEHLIIDIAR